ncbi:hypothetical protein RUM43_011306 [Polyplax serrata]|uniref:Uncharacterized protein n=1 Tax=Polyplax serrata TaxID=468196 RepID=A0AAN8RTH5_POLSC
MRTMSWDEIKGDSKRGDCKRSKTIKPNETQEKLRNVRKKSDLHRLKTKDNLQVTQVEGDGRQVRGEISEEKTRKNDERDYKKSIKERNEVKVKRLKEDEEVQLGVCAINYRAEQLNFVRKRTRDETGSR